MVHRGNTRSAPSDTASATTARPYRSPCRSTCNASDTHGVNGAPHALARYQRTVRAVIFRHPTEPETPHADNGQLTKLVSGRLPHNNLFPY